MNNSTEKILKIDLIQILYSTTKYIVSNKLFTVMLASVNMFYMIILKYIDNSSPLIFMIIWLFTYYMFWCFFYRYYYNLKPYFINGSIFKSVVPSSRSILILVLISLAIMISPMVPLLLGFSNDAYLEALENLSSQNMSSLSSNVSVSYIFLGLIVFSLVSPSLFCKPYLSWIASLRGRTISFKKVKNKCQGNYWNFVAISAFLLLFDAIGILSDKFIPSNGFIPIICDSVALLYTNVIFAKLYDFFYIKN